MGRIFVYRTAPRSLGIPPNMVVDNRTYEQLLPDVGYRLDVHAGPHVVTLAYIPRKIEVIVEPGKEVFVRFDLDPSIFGGGFYPVLVDDETARAELRTRAGVDFECAGGSR
jgi:hypothetical protein